MLIKEFIKDDNYAKEGFLEEIKTKNITPGIYEEENIIELLEKGEYNYYRMKFDHSFRIKWMYLNIKNFVKQVFEYYLTEFKYFMKRLFSKDFYYNDGKSLLFVELTEKAKNPEELKVHLLMINEELNKEREEKNNINLLSNEALNSNK